jgi:hypothetical protein
MTPRFIEFWDGANTLRIPDGTGWLRYGGPDCDSNRNRAIRTLLEQPEPQWAFFVDDDQEIEPDILINLLDVMYSELSLSVVTGLYVRKTPPFQPVLFGSAVDTAKSRLTYTQLNALRAKGNIVKVEACGGGCLLVRREVLANVYTTLPNGDKAWFVPGPGRSFGGDIGFSRLLKTANIDIYAFIESGVGHLMPCSIKPSWNEKLQRWMISFTFGGKGFELDLNETDNY